MVAALAEAHTGGERAVLPLVTGGRYGLSSKELTPGMVAGIFAELARERPRPRFTIGIHDDVSGLSLPYDPSLDIEPPGTIRAVFFGLGSDGTVGANKNTIKILGAEENLNAQGYFVYDSKKSGSQTVSHLRFGPQPIRAPYLVQQASFVGCHHFGLLDRVDVLGLAAPGATLLLDCKLPADEVWDALPRPVQEKILAKRIEVYAIDAGHIAREAGLAGRTNTVLQTCFFAISGVLPRDEAIAKIKAAIAKTYGRRGAEVVAKNHAAVDATLEGLHQIEVPGRVTSDRELPAMVPASAPEFVRTVTAMMMAGRGDELPVSMLPVDGTYPSGTTAYEKRNISELVAEWDPDLCIQCGNCSFVCPHSVIRATYYDESLLKEAPSDFKSAPLDARGLPDTRFTLQVYVEDCTGCELCVQACPVGAPDNPERKAINLAARAAAGGRRTGQRRVLRDAAGGRPVPGGLRHGARHAVPAAAVRVLRRLRGLRRDAVRQAPVAAVRRPADGRERHRLLLDLRREPAHHAVDDQRRRARPGLVELPVRGQRRVRPRIPAGRRPAHRASPKPPGRSCARRSAPTWRTRSSARHSSPSRNWRAQLDRVAELKRRLEALDQDYGHVADLRSVVDHLVRRSVWIVGGDGWAYDIGSSGLDHVLATGRNVNVLVLDTEVYSNTGGQSSKSTPLGAVAKFASAGKTVPKKDIALQAIAYGNVYVARVAMGADPQQTLRAFREAEAYDGPSLVIAYSHCIAHGIEIRTGLDQQYRAVASGHWPLIRYDPLIRTAGGNPFLLDSPRPRISLASYTQRELRYRSLSNTNPAEAERLGALAQEAVDLRWSTYEEMATRGAQRFPADARKDD